MSNPLKGTASAAAGFAAALVRFALSKRATAAQRWLIVLTLCASLLALAAAPVVCGLVLRAWL